MKIVRVLEKLYGVYKKGDQNLGCVDRANILYYFMKNEGLNPKRKLFSFRRDDKGMISSHCIIVLNGMVYDTNIEPSQNPIAFNEYEKIKKGQYSNLDLEWEDWEDSITEKNYPIDFLWNYLDAFDEEFQKEIKSLVKEKYEHYIKKYSYLIELRLESMNKVI